MIYQQDSLFLDVEINDFAELSNLLGEDFLGDRTTAGNLESLMPASYETKQNVRLPEFDYISSETNHHVSSTMETGLSSAHHGRMLEPARVSPTPSTSMMPVAISANYLPSGPDVPALPDKVKSLASTKKLTTTSRKRKASNDEDHESCVTEEELATPSSKQKNRRRERNREHAKRSRSKKKDLTKSLEESLAMLKEENQRMKEFVYKKLQTSKEEADKMIKERVVTPSERFASALKNPSNRVLSKSAISYLQSLGKDCRR